jgi:ubiquinone biosynthesis protein
MTDITGTLLKHRKRLNEIAGALARHGLAAWAARGGGIAGLPPIDALVHHVVSEEDIGASDGERLRHALAELGTTAIKFGQMLSLRPDVVGQDIADELALLQADVPADAPGVAVRTVEAQLGKPVAELYRTFDAQPLASGSVAQVHRATLSDGTPVAVKVLHDRADATVREDLELLEALAAFLESEDTELARLRPTIIVAEFAGMMEAAIDLRQELANLQEFRRNFAREPDVVIPEPHPELSGQQVLTMSMLTGQPFTDRAGVEAAGWDAEVLVRRAAEIYLEMIFRDGLYHADPHPGNVLLPDGQHLAILDFGDVGRLSTHRREQLESLVIAVGTHDVDSLIDIVVELTTPPPDVDMRALRSAVETWLNRSLLVDVGHLDMNGIIASGMQLLHQHQLVVPADLALLFRVLLRLEGLGRGVETDVRITELVEPYVHRIMAMRFDPTRVARHVGRAARSWDHLISGLPDDLRAILEQIRTGTVGIDFRIHDTDQAVDRLVDGIVTAASLMAGAQLISRRTAPLAGQVSIPGLLAAGVGVITWQRLIARRKPRGRLVTRVRKALDVARRGSASSTV